MLCRLSVRAALCAYSMGKIELVSYNYIHFHIYFLLSNSYVFSGNKIPLAHSFSIRTAPLNAYVPLSFIGLFAHVTRGHSTYMVSSSRTLGVRLREYELSVSVQANLCPNQSATRDHAIAWFTPNSLDLEIFQF